MTKNNLDVFLQAYADRPRIMSEDEVYNYVFGIANVFDLHMEKLFDVFKQEFQLDEYATPMQKEYRAEVLGNLFGKKKPAKKKPATKKPVKKGKKK